MNKIEKQFQFFVKLFFRPFLCYKCPFIFSDRKERIRNKKFQNHFRKLRNVFTVKEKKEFCLLQTQTILVFDCKKKCLKKQQILEKDIRKRFYRKIILNKVEQRNFPGNLLCYTVVFPGKIPNNVNFLDDCFAELNIF